MDYNNAIKKNYEVVTGLGDNLVISPVYTHIPISKPKLSTIDISKIIIPQENKNK